MPEAARARSSGEPGPVLERSRCRRCFPLCRWALPLGARPLPSLGTVAPPRARPGWLPMGRGRCALGEKAFSSDPRGCLGVPNPPAVAPPRARSVACTAAFVGYGPPPRGAGGLEDAASFSRPLPRPAPPPSETGEDPAGPGRRFRPRVRGARGVRVGAPRARAPCGRVPKGGRDAEALPRPRRASASALRAASLARSRPRGVCSPAEAPCRGHVSWPACPRGGVPLGTRVSTRVGPGRKDGERRGRLPLAARCARGPRWRGRAVQRRGALEGFSEGLVPQEGGPAGVPGVAGPPCVSVAVGSPCVFPAARPCPRGPSLLGGRPRLPRARPRPPSAGSASCAPPALPASPPRRRRRPFVLPPRRGGEWRRSATARPRETGAFRRAGVAPSALPPTPGAGAGRRLRAKFALRGPRPVGAPPALAAGWRLAGVCAGPGSAREGGRTVEPCSSRRGRGRGGAAGALSRGWGLGRRFLGGRGCRSSSSRGCRGTAPGLGGLRR